MATTKQYKRNETFEDLREDMLSSHTPKIWKVMESYIVSEANLDTLSTEDLKPGEVGDIESLLTSLFLEAEMFD